MQGQFHWQKMINLTYLNGHFFFLLWKYSSGDIFSIIQNSEKIFLKAEKSKKVF